MDTPDPRCHMTPSRRAWLQQLQASPYAGDPKTRVSFDCMALMWTCYAYRDMEHGDVISGDEARERYGTAIDDWWPKVERYGEMITKWGRMALERWP